MSVIYQVWWGRRSFTETFWFWGILVGGLLFDCTWGLAFVGASKVFSKDCYASGQAPLAYLYLCVALSVAIKAWLAVGVARSRTRMVAPWSAVVKTIAVIVTVAAVPIAALVILVAMLFATCPT